MQYIGSAYISRKPVQVVLEMTTFPRVAVFFVIFITK